MNEIISPEVCIVEASAGSGKTYALAKRFIQLLINPRLDISRIPLRNILAITFTNKATVEMKERILELLKKIALDVFASKEEEEDILGILGVTKTHAQEKARLIMDEIIKHYNFFQVQTIDSFINTLLLGSALNIDRSASFTIKRDYLETLAYCLDLTIEYAATNENVFAFLDEFLQHYLFVENRTGWFPKQDILALTQSLFQVRNKYGRPFKLYEGESKDVIAGKKYIFQRLKALCEKFPQGTNASAQKYICAFVEKSKDIFDIADLPAALHKPDVPMNKDKKCPAEFGALWEEIHRELKNLIDLDARVAFKPYIKLFNNLLAFFQDVSKEKDVLFLEELNQTARLLFGEEGITVAELYYRVATRFYHYLIDEFQDTSELQWNNLEMMVEEALSTGGTLFYVGDKKQAIYRFRGGEVELFDRVRGRFADYNLKTASLTKNWRSQKAIVEFNNTVFSRDDLKRALAASKLAKELSYLPHAEEEILAVFKDSHQEYRPQKTGGFVAVQHIDEKNQVERDEIVQPRLIELVNDLYSRNYRYEDIAFLTRDNTEVELVTSWLLQAGIPVESEKTLNVLENPLIKELCSLLRFLHSPVDNLSFASFILGDVFAKAGGLPFGETTEFLFTVHMREKLKNGVSLYRLFRDAYPRAWKSCIEPLFKSTGFISPYELITSIYQCLDVFTHFPDAQAFFMKFLELIKVKEDEYTGLGEFLAYLPEALADDLYVTVTHSDSVKVLTVHKAKGLEFPVVIIPFLRMDIKPGFGGNSNKSPRFYFEDEYAPELGMLRITEKHREYSLFLQKVHARSFLKSCIDELNTMYVALTRAEQELYAFIPKKSAGKNNLARVFIPGGLTEMGQKQSAAMVKEERQPLLPIAPTSLQNWIEVLRSEFAAGPALKNRQRIQKGTILHYILSQITILTPQSKEAVMNEAFTRASRKYPVINGDESFKDKIRRLLDTPSVRDFFYLSPQEVYCEKEIVTALGDTKRIDRLIVKEKEVWIIDYKSAYESREIYRQQIQEYIQLIKELYPHRAVKGYLVYIEEIKVEEMKLRGLKPTVS